jgi:hypothetical protein
LAHVPDPVLSMSDQALGSTRLEDLERAWMRIPAVSAAKVVLSPSGDIAEVHVVASDKRSPKLVVRDIQSVARAMFFLDIDYRRVSVVQLPAENGGNGSAPHAAHPADLPVENVREPDLVAVEQMPEHAPVVQPPAQQTPPPAPQRVPSGVLHVEPSVSKVIISQSGALTEVSVEVVGPAAVGSSSVRGPSSQVAMLAARAALGAREALGADDAAVVAGVDESNVGGRQVVIVAAIVAGPAGEVFATACAPVTGSVAEAAAAAALQAVAGRVG